MYFLGNLRDSFNGKWLSLAGQGTSCGFGRITDHLSLANCDRGMIQT